MCAVLQCPEKSQVRINISLYIVKMNNYKCLYSRYIYPILAAFYLVKFRASKRPVSENFHRRKIQLLVSGKFQPHKCLRFSSSDMSKCPLIALHDCMMVIGHIDYSVSALSDYSVSARLMFSVSALFDVSLSALSEDLCFCFV